MFPNREEGRILTEAQWRAWRNWQTRVPCTHLGGSPWGFESPRSHRQSGLDMRGPVDRFGARAKHPRCAEFAAANDCGDRCMNATVPLSFWALSFDGRSAYPVAARPARSAGSAGVKRTRIAATLMWM